MTKPILIWGAGAIGGTLGAAFIRSGHDVVFVDNEPAHVASVNEKGLRIAGPIFEDVVKAVSFMPENLAGQFDLVFLCVKALHTDAAARALAPHVAPDGMVVSAQNGLNEIILAQIIGSARTIGCFVNFGADYLEPGLVHYSGHGAVVIGELDGRITPRIKKLHRLMQEFEPEAVVSRNIWGFLWGKLIYGALLFATALTNESIADVLADLKARPVLTRLGREIGAVVAAEKIKCEAFDGFDPAAFTPNASQTAIERSFDDMVGHNRASAKSHSGIWRDLAIRKRKTEAEAQLGPIIEAGRRHGVPTPLTLRLIAMVKQIEDGQIQLGMANLDVLADTGGLQTGKMR